MTTKNDSLHDRLVYSFGRDRVQRELSDMVSRWHQDPLRYLTDEAKQELFDRLRADLRWTKRNNARNREIARQRAATLAEQRDELPIGASA